MTDHEHVSVDDPGYRGFRVTRLWILTAIDPEDDTEGLISVPLELAVRFHLSAGPAIASDEVRASNLRALGRELAERYEMKTKLTYMTPERDVERFG